MSVPRLDPRSNVDRIYQYGEYQMLSATFKRRKPRGIFRFVPAPLATRLRQRSAVRMLPFKLTLVCGMLASLLGLGALAYFSADNVRLAYAKDELETSISGLNQSMAEAVSTNTQQQNAVLKGSKVLPTEVMYPAQTKYLVLTNIPNASGRTMVEQLYPLSRRIIRVQP